MSNQSMGIESVESICLIERGLYRQNHSVITASLPQFPRDTRALHLDYLYTPDERLELWRKHNSDSLREVRILYAGYGVEQSETTETSNRFVGFDTTYTQITEPGNIQRIGVEISKFLTDTEGETHPTVIFIDSLSLMLQYVSLRTATQFIQECFTLLRRFEAGGQFYFTPAMHDEETVNAIESLFSSELS